MSASPLPSSPIYFDYLASCPVDGRVCETMMNYLTKDFGNPTSKHFFGVQAKAGIDKARCSVANLIGCAPENIIFTSGGSESNALAINGGLASIKEQFPERDHVIISAIEHSAVSKTVHSLKGYRVTVLPTDQTGRISIKDLRAAIEPNKTAMVSIMTANNEVGTIQPLKEIATACHEHGIKFHTDGAQAVGKIPLNVIDLDVDMISFASHKMYGPKGVGALYCKGDFRPKALILGSGQECSLRSGTHNVPGITGFGKAAELVLDDLNHGHHNDLREMRDDFERKLKEAFPTAVINGHPTERLPIIISIGIPGIKGFDLMMKLKDSVCFSAGAACNTGKVSPTMTALKIPLENANGTFRISMGRFTTSEHIETALQLIIESVHGLLEAK